MISRVWKNWLRKSLDRSNGRGRRPFRGARLGVEQLEARDCPSTAYTLANFSFEAPALQAGVNGAPQTLTGTNDLYLGNVSITSWAVAGTNVSTGIEAGVVRDASALPVTTGAQHGRIVIASPAGAGQVTVTSSSPTTIAANTAYTFTLDVAGDDGFASAGNVATAGKNDINLLANGVVIASTPIPTNLTTANTPISVTFDSGLNHADNGQALSLQIAIGNKSTPASSVSVDFDNATLVSSGDNSTTTSAATSAATVAPGAAVTFTATVAANVAPFSPAPAGTVQFFDNGSTTPLSDGGGNSTFTLTPDGGNTASTASITLSTLLAGGHEIKAVYTPGTGETHNNSSGYVAQNVHAAGVLFTSGNLVVDATGDGANPVNSSAEPVFLDQYNSSATSQAPITSTILPLSTASGNNAFTIGGTDSGDGLLETSTDGRYLVLAGFQTSPGTSGVKTSPVAAVPREVALVANGGAVDTSTVINDAYNSYGFRSATTLDGEVEWTAGEDPSGGVRAVLDGNLTSSGNIAASSPVSTGVANDIDAVGILTANGASQLYATSGAGYNGVATLGTGTATNNLNGAGFETPVINEQGLNSSQFVYVAAGGGTPQAPASGDLLYVADTSPYVPGAFNQGGLQKWTYGGGWSFDYSMMVSPSSGDFLATTAVVADPSSANTFYVISGKDSNGANYLFKIVDNGSYGSQTTTLLATSPANTLFHGVAFAPTSGIGTTPVSSIGLQSSAPTANYGAQVVLTATVTAATTPSGYITFRSADGNTIYGEVALAAGATGTATASLTIPATAAATPFSALALDTDNIVAVYGGNGTYAGATASLAQVVNPISVAPTFTSPAATTVIAGSSTPFQVASIAPGDTSAITYSLGGTVPAGVTISPTLGVLTVPQSIAAGTYMFTITAQNDSATTQNPFTLTVATSTAEPFKGGDLVLLQDGNGVNVYPNGTAAPVFLDEISATTPGVTNPNFTPEGPLDPTTQLGTSFVQQVTVPPSANGNVQGNQQLNIDLGTPGRSGELLRSQDGSELSFDGNDNGPVGTAGTGVGSTVKTIAVVGDDPTLSNINTTTYATMDNGDEARGSVVTDTGAIYSVGHQPNGGVNYFPGEGDDTGPSTPTEIDNNGNEATSANATSLTIAFDGRLYWTTAGATGAFPIAGTYTSATGALPTAPETATGAISAVSAAASTTTITSPLVATGTIVTITTPLYSSAVPNQVIEVSGLGGSGYTGNFIITSVDPVGGTISYMDTKTLSGTPGTGSAELGDILVVGVTDSVATSDPSYEDAAAKLGDLWIADMNGDGKLDVGDRVYYLDNGTQGASHSGVYVSTLTSFINGVAQWSIPFNIGDGPSPSLSSSGPSQLNHLIGAVVSPTEVDLYATNNDKTAGHITALISMDDVLGGGQGSAANSDTVTSRLLQAVQNGTSGFTEEIRGVSFAPVGPTTNTLTASGIPSGGGQTLLTLTDTLSTTASGGPTGFVGILEDGTTLLPYQSAISGSGSLAATGANTSQATYTIEVSGTHTFQAVYDSGTFAQAASSTVTTTPITVTAQVNGSTAPILSVSASSGVVTVTTDGSSGFAAGQPVQIAGVDGTGGATGFNGAYTIASVTGNSFTYADANAAGSNTGGGTATTSGAAGLLTNGASNLNSQRSMVDSIVYTFNQAVKLGAGAITITVLGQGGMVPAVAYASPDGGFTWVVTFSGSGVVGNSIANGEYQIALNAASVSAVAGGGTMPASDAESFYRLYGDTVGNGHQRVNTTDTNTFLGTFNLRSTAGAFLAYLDYLDSGRINTADTNAFLGDFNIRFGGFLATI